MDWHVVSNIKLSPMINLEKIYFLSIHTYDYFIVQSIHMSISPMVNQFNSSLWLIYIWFY